MSSNNTDKKQLSYWKNQEPPESGKLFTDPLFPPNKNSLLGLDSNGKAIDPTAYKQKASQIDTNVVGFARATEIFESGCKLFSEKIEMGDVIQGNLGDCYFLTSVACLCEFPGLIMNLFKTKSFNKDGFYEIALFIDGKPQIVIVDDYLPVEKSTGKPCYSQSKGNELWVMLLEKAWAKVNGGYANIITGLPSEALEFLTGFGSLIYELKNLKDIDDINEYKNEIVKNVLIADKNNCLISCSTSKNQDTEKVGLVIDHAYSLVSCHQIKTSQGKTVYLFRIRNPWSKGEWNGDWGDKSKLWDDKAKSQVDFLNKEDGIFFMNDTDFFKYFTRVEICYILFNSSSTIYSVEGEQNLKNASVFNIQTEGEGFLSVSVLRKTWRTNRELRDKILPTHISIVKYDPKPKSRHETFSDYNGNLESFEIPTLNVKVVKGNYLIYVYRDYDHAQFTPENTMKVKITCSAKFKHAQMSYDERSKGFPLLQNIILQAEFIENNYNPDKGEDFEICSTQLRGNGMGHYIYYISTPGYYLDFDCGVSKQRNYIMLSPYLNNETMTFHRAIPSGKYLVLLALMNGVNGEYYFKCINKIYTLSREVTVEYDNNDIDLTIYTDINNNIKNEKVRERVTQSLENAQKQFYFDIGDGKMQKKSLSELQKTYEQYIKLLDEITLTNSSSSSNSWGIMKGEYVTFIGQYNGDQKEGKGLFITPNNVFVGEFKNDLQNGMGITYNKDGTKLYTATYVNGMRKGNVMTPEEEEENQKAEEQKKKEEELKKEKDKLIKLEEEKQALLKKQKEEEKKLEEQLQAELKKAEEAKKAEERFAEEMQKALEEASRLEEERQKQIQKQKEEAERLAREEKERLEEAARKAEEQRKKEEERIKKAAQEAEELRKKEEERIKQELEKLAKEKEEEAKKKAEELKKQEEELKKEAQRKAQEAKKQMEEAQKEAQRKEEELKKEAEKKAEEAKKKAEEEKIAAEKKLLEQKKAAEKKAEEAKKKAEEAKKEAEKKEEEARKKAEEAKKEAERQAEEMKQKVEKEKNEAKKAQEDFNNYMAQRRAEMEERQRQQQIRMQEERQMWQQRGGQGNTIGLHYGDNTRSKKRRQNNILMLPFEDEMKDICITCGCSIF